MFRCRCFYSSVSTNEGWCWLGCLNLEVITSPPICGNRPAIYEENMFPRPSVTGKTLKIYLVECWFTVIITYKTGFYMFSVGMKRFFLYTSLYRLLTCPLTKWCCLENCYNCTYIRILEYIVQHSLFCLCLAQWKEMLMDLCYPKPLANFVMETKTRSQKPML